MKFESWGRTPKAEHLVTTACSRNAPMPRIGKGTAMLPFGCGRSYGDSCLNDGGGLIAMRGLDRFIHFDPETGDLRVEAGVTLEEILDFAVPRGWFLPVSPGTKFVTVGGAIANDIHGKNHHRAGNFGNHVRELELLRSDGSRLHCRPDEDECGWFRATVGGLGLTGLITWATIRLRPIHNTMIQVERIKFPNVDAFFELAEASDAAHEYTVAWVDVLARGESLGRGIFMRGNHAGPDISKQRVYRSRKFNVPFNAPGWLLNKWSIKAFNGMFYGKQFRKKKLLLEHYEPFFYPLDTILNWNRLYGRNGLFQYQCVVPFELSREPIKEILQAISHAGQGSFLAVLKVFGDLPRAGLMSFPRPGVTLALDFANRGERTLKLLADLDRITVAAGGLVYPAKDARMSAEHFQQYFPHWQELEPYIDPALSSSFWRRVTGN